MKTDGGRVDVTEEIIQIISKFKGATVTYSQLYPGGKAQFGDQILDVLTQGEMIEKGRPVKIIGHTGPDAVVEEAS